MDPAREDVLRISVDTVHDWNRIKRNYSKAALTLLDETLAGGNSNLKHDILPHLNHFIEDTFQIVRPNIRVNGRNFDDFEFNDHESEGFDEGLDRRIWSLSEQCLQWDVDIARKRRERPLEVERLMHEILQQNADDPRNANMFQEIQNELVQEDSLSYNAEDTVRRTFALSDELQQVIPHQLQRLDTLANAESVVYYSLKSCVQS